MEFMPDDMKDRMRANNESIRVEAEQSEAQRLEQLRDEMKALKRVIKPSAGDIASNMVENMTGRQPLDFIAREGIGTLQARTRARNGLRQIIPNALSGLGQAAGGVLPVVLVPLAIFGMIKLYKRSE